MFPNTRQPVAETIDSIEKHKTLPFTEILDAEMVKDALAAEGVSYNQSIYTPFLTLCTFLSQVLDPRQENGSCQENGSGRFLDSGVRKTGQILCRRAVF